MKRRIIDSHHHLWKLDVLDYPWLSEPIFHPLPGLGDISSIQKDYPVDKYLKDTSGFDLLGSVHVEAVVRPDLADEENAWLNTIADRHAVPGAIVAFLDVLSDTAVPRAEALAETPRIAGVRQILNWDAAAPTWSFAASDILAAPAMRETAKHLAHLGLSFDAQVWHHQFSDLARLHDDTGLKVAVNHCGMPRSLDPEYIAAWFDDLSVFAGRPDISMKFSGMTMFRRDWTSDAVRQVFERLVEVFGPSRLMWGSNFPVDSIGVSYPDCVARAEQLVAEHSNAFADAFFVTNTARFYGINAYD